MYAVTLRINHVSRSFGSVQAVKDVWLDTPAGSVMGVIGPNGAGKTTTMRMILRILTPETGDIAWSGKPVELWPLGTFGYLPEERGMYPQMRGIDELRFFARLHGMQSRQADQEIAHWAKWLSLDDVLTKKVEELSKGNAQKLQFLAAVLHRPQLVILDEPFSGLDPVNTRLFKEAVKHLHEMGSTILFSSHQMDYVEELCDRVCLIAEGRTLIHGSLDQVRQQSGTRVLSFKLAQASSHVTSRTDASDNLHPLAGLVKTAATAAIAEPAGIRLLECRSGYWRYELMPSIDTDAILRFLLSQGNIHHFSVDYPSLEDIYISSVSQNRGNADPPRFTDKAAEKEAAVQ